MALQSPPTKKTKVLIEKVIATKKMYLLFINLNYSFVKVQILDESTGQIIVKEQSPYADFIPYTYAASSAPIIAANNSSKCKSRNQPDSFQLIESNSNKSVDISLEYLDVDVESFSPNKQIILLEPGQSSSSSSASSSCSSSYQHQQQQQQHQQHNHLQQLKHNHQQPHQQHSLSNLTG